MCKHTSVTILTRTLHACLMGVSLSEMLCCFLLFTLHILCEQLFPRGSEEFVIKHIYHRVTNPNVILWALVVPQLKFSPGQHRLTFSTQNARLTRVENFNMKTFVFFNPPVASGKESQCENARNDDKQSKRAKEGRESAGLFSLRPLDVMDLVPWITNITNTNLVLSGCCLPDPLTLDLSEGFFFFLLFGISYINFVIWPLPSYLFVCLFVYEINISFAFKLAYILMKIFLVE